MFFFRSQPLYSRGKKQTCNWKNYVHKDLKDKKSDYWIPPDMNKCSWCLTRLLQKDVDKPFWDGALLSCHASSIQNVNLNLAVLQARCISVVTLPHCFFGMLTSGDRNCWLSFLLLKLQNMSRTLMLRIKCVKGLREKKAITTRQNFCLSLIASFVHALTTYCPFF